VGLCNQGRLTGVAPVGISPVIALFRGVFFCAIALSFTAGGLVTASFFIPDRAPQSGWYIGVHLVVTGAFLLLGVLLYGIQRHVAAIATFTRRSEDAGDRDLRHDVNRLLAYLIAAGIILGAILGLMTYVILARIDQGFAVFG
jgi:hypothetical protein